MLHRAVSALKAGDFRQAAAVCEQALEQQDSGNRIQVLNILGIAQLNLGSFTACIETLSRLLELSPSDDAAWYHRGLCHQNLGDWQAAGADYGRAYQLSPGRINIQVNYANALLKSAETERALDVINDSLVSAPGNEHLETLKAQTLYALSRWNEALAVLEQLDRQELNPDLNVLKSKVLLGAGRIEQSLAILNGMGAAIEAHYEALVTRSVVLDKLEQFRDAIIDARMALKLRPDRYLSHYNLAAFLSRRFSADELQEAETAASKALQLNPDAAEAWDALALVLGKQQRFEQAITAADNAVKKDGTNYRYHLTLGDLCDRAGNLEKSISTLESCLSSHAGVAEVSRQLGIAYLKSGQYNQALEALSRAEQLDPEDQRVIAHRQIALIHSGLEDEARSYFNSERNIRIIELQVPASYDSVEDFNTELARDILEHSTLRYEPIGLAAREGSLTEELRDDQTEAILAFEQSLISAIDSYISSLSSELVNQDDPFIRNLPRRGYRLNLWATAVDSGGQIDTHIHEESWLSGAYYVQSNIKDRDIKDSTDGYLEIGRPHAGLPEPDQQWIRTIPPRPGTLVLFPSFVFHRTIPDTSSGQRISIAFDLRELEHEEDRG